MHLTRRPIVGLLYKPRMICDECGAVGEIRIVRGNRSTRIKPAPVSLCPPQIPHELTWGLTRAAAVGSQRLSSCVMARPSFQRNLGRPMDLIPPAYHPKIHFNSIIHLPAFWSFYWSHSF
jgi:hypothetical protein